jgi:hypothetical protein
LVLFEMQRFGWAVGGKTERLKASNGLSKMGLTRLLKQIVGRLAPGTNRRTGV